MSGPVSLPLLAYLCADESASDTYLGADESFWALLNAIFSTPLILSLLGPVTVIIFSPWQVGRHSGCHQMSHSQRPLSKAVLLAWCISSGKLRPIISILGVALKDAPPYLHGLCGVCLF